MKYFQVKYGYGKNDYHSIPEEDLPKAIKAQVKGEIAVFRSGTVSGNNIIAITPDYHKLMGYNHDYELTGEDMQEIGRKNMQEHEDAIEGARDLLLNNKKQLHG